MADTPPERVLLSSEPEGKAAGEIRKLGSGYAQTRKREVLSVEEYANKDAPVLEPLARGDPGDALLPVSPVDGREVAVAGT